MALILILLYLTKQYCLLQGNKKKRNNNKAIAIHRLVYYTAL